LIDIEESHNLDMEKIHNYSYNMTDTSQLVELPKNINDFMFFHGFIDSITYEKIQQNYGNSTLDCEEFVITYSNNTIMFEKNSFV
jgi:UDP-2,3-diacylglucosamine pyrophosphatase LpxH